MKVSFCPLVGGERIRQEKRVIGSFIFFSLGRDGFREIKYWLDRLSY
jgi:hypothetical protein